jgi:hypothetical protein
MGRWQIQTAYIYLHSGVDNKHATFALATRKYSRPPYLSPTFHLEKVIVVLCSQEFERPSGGWVKLMAPPLLGAAALGRKLGWATDLLEGDVRVVRAHEPGGWRDKC